MALSTDRMGRDQDSTLGGDLLGNQNIWVARQRERQSKDVLIERTVWALGPGPGYGANIYPY